VPLILPPPSLLPALLNPTETFSDGILPLVKAGNITNAKKKENQGRIVTAFCSGTRALYDFIDDNPMVKFLVGSGGVSLYKPSAAINLMLPF